MKQLMKTFWRDETGAMAIEYGLIAALVSIGAIAALTALGGSLDQLFATVSSALGNTSTP